MNHTIQSNGVPEPAGYYEETLEEIADKPISPKIEKPLPPLVIFHSPCLDGFTAAWAAWLKYPEAEFVPGVYGQYPPDCYGREVYLLDFSYKRDVLREMVAVAKSVIVLDHHKTAEAELGDLLSEPLSGLKGVFDMEKSGARLAWEWFHPGVPTPKMVLYVEDRDLWRFSMLNSKELNAYFFSFDYDFKLWSDIRTDLENREFRSEMIAAGLAIERKHQKDVKELAEKLRGWMKFDDLIPPRVVPAINLPYTYASDAGNLLAQDAPFAAVYYQDGRGEFVFSLRSVEGGMDVSEVAAHYGGGGHKHAAGFRVKSLEEL